MWVRERAERLGRTKDKSWALLLCSANGEGISFPLGLGVGSCLCKQIPTEDISGQKPTKDEAGRPEMWITHSGNSENVIILLEDGVNDWLQKQDRAGVLEVDGDVCKLRGGKRRAETAGEKEFNLGILWCEDSKVTPVRVDLMVKVPNIYCAPKIDVQGEGQGLGTLELALQAVYIRRFGHVKCVPESWDAMLWGGWQVLQECPNLCQGLQRKGVETGL
ncbi:hypothetical protein C8R46DRAFT_1025908 [Mycena filopes]|nr:hypothetical protein C8R46DRAFT_1025908 [Mycena filopes]